MAYLPPMNGGRLNASISSAAGGSVAGASLISTGTMNLVAGSNITLSQAAGNITFSAPNAHNVSFGGNMAGAAAMISTGTLSFYGGNNITLSQNANNVTINGPTAGGGSVNFSAGTTSSNLASVRFADSNGVGFGLNGSVITASYTQQAMFDAGVSNLGNTAGTTGTNTNGLFLAGSNNITLSQSTNANGATVSIVGPTFTTANNVSLGINNGTVTASASFNQTQQTANVIQAVSAGGSMMTAGTLTMSNANGVSFGLNNGTLTAQHNGLTSQSLQTSNIIQGAAVAGSTLTSGSLLFSNANGVSFGMNGSVLTASTNAAGGGVAISAGGANFSTGTLAINAAGGLSLATAAQNLTISAPAASSITASNLTLSTNGSTIGFSANAPFDGGISGGNSAGVSATTITGGMYLVGGNNITLSQTYGVNGATITISGGGGGLDGTISNWEPLALQYGSISNTLRAGSTNGVVFFNKLMPEANISASRFLQLISMSMSSSSNSSHAGAISMYAGIYTVNGSSLSLITQSSGSVAYQWTNSSSNSFGVLTGLQGFTMPLNVNFSQGNYWIGLMSRTTSTNANWFTASNMVFQNTGNSAYSFMGNLMQATNATQGVQEGVGYYSAVTTALPSFAAMSQITQSVFRSNNPPYMNFKNQAW